MTRDASGNTYVAYPTSTYSTYQLKVDKINAQGAVVWSQPIAAALSQVGTQFSVRRMIFAHGRVYVLFQSRASGGTGTFGQSFLRYVDPSNGFSNQILASTTQFEGLASYSAGVAIAGIRTDAAAISKFGPTGAFLGGVEVNGYNQVDDVTCAPDGTAFVATTLLGGIPRLLRVNSDNSTSTFDFDVPTRTDETMSRVVLDAANNRVYGMGKGLFNGIPTDVDVTLYAINTDFTIPSSTGYGGSLIETPGDISVLSGGGVAISYFSDSSSPDTTVVRRLNSILGSLWTATLAEAVNQNPPKQAFDADGNLLVYDNRYFDEDHYMRITKLAVASGTNLGTTSYKRTNVRTLELLSDAAGSYYVTTEDGYNVQLFKLQPATMLFTDNTVPGGTAIAGTIMTANPAASDQVWTLASANPTAASVPATVTIPTGLSLVDFNIVTSPVAANINIGISARYQGFILQKTLTLLTPTVSALSISPNVVIGGVNTAGLVTISGAAPTGGKTVNLSSSNTAAATVPASVVIPAGSTSFGFGVTTFGVTANRGVVITATTGAISKTAFFAVNAPSLMSVAMNPTSIKGGFQSAMTVTLDGIAPTGGRSVVIFSGAPAIVFAPASVTIPAGSANITQNLVTAPVTSSTNVLIFATRSGIYKTATITVTP